MGKGSRMKSKQISQSKLKMRAAATLRIEPVMALEYKSTLRVAARVRKMQTDAPTDHL